MHVRAGRVAAGLLAAGAALVGMACQPCVTSDMCGAGNVCAGGVCRAERETPPNASASGGTSGASGGGSSSSSSGGSGDGGSGSSSSSGAPDAGGIPDAGRPDAAGFNITMAATPTAVAVNETGTQLVVATNADLLRNTFETVQLPVVTGAPHGNVPLDNTAGRCDIGLIAIRGASHFTVCSATPAAIRAFNGANGAMLGTVRSVDPNALVVDHADMLGVMSQVGAGGFGYTSPAASPDTAVNLPNGDQPVNIGIGLVEDSAGAMRGAITVGEQLNALKYWSYTNSFSLAGTVNVGALLTVTNIASGRGVAAGVRPVVMAEATGGRIVVFHGPDLVSASTGANVVAVRTVTGLQLPPQSALKLKVARDGQYVYFLNSGGSALCRVALQRNVTPESSCRPLPSGCVPVDHAPPVAGSPAFVACSALNAVHALPGF